MNVLWVKRSVPDSYVDSSFLSRLKRNENVVKYHFSTIVQDASVLLVNLTLSVIHLLSFVAIYSRAANPRHFVVCGGAVDLVLAYKWMQRKPREDRVLAVKSTFLTIIVIVILTPVLRSLTESTSSDSIWAMCGWLLLVNLVALSRSSPALSTNTALATTIVLASRLNASPDVFYFVLFNVETFVTQPVIYKWLRFAENSDRWSYGMLFVMALGSWVLVAWILGYLMLALWVGLQLLILGGLPKLFLSLQKYKDRISGPWDRAQPILN